MGGTKSADGEVEHWLASLAMPSCGELTLELPVVAFGRTWVARRWRLRGARVEAETPLGEPWPERPGVEPFPARLDGRWCEGAAWR